MTNIGSPTRFSGMNGNGGARCQAGKPPYSRGASLMKSRKYRSSAGPSATSKNIMPA